MKFNRIIYLVFMLMILMTTSTSSITLSENEALGGGDRELRLSEISFFDRLKMTFTPFTVAPTGEVCSLNPDIFGSFLYVGGDECWTAEEYPQVLQVWEMADNGHYLDMIADYNMAKGETKCLKGLKPNTKYANEIYICTKAAEIPRECADSDGGMDANIKGKLMFTLGSESASFDDVCTTNNEVLERYCDADNSVASKAISCKDWQCKDGKCIAASTTTPTTPSTPSVPLIICGDGNCNSGEKEAGCAFDCASVEPDPIVDICKDQPTSFACYEKDKTAFCIKNTQSLFCGQEKTWFEENITLIVVIISSLVLIIFGSWMIWRKIK